MSDLRVDDVTQSRDCRATRRRLSDVLRASHAAASAVTDLTRTRR